jgi:hypothetical protein
VTVFAIVYERNAMITLAQVDPLVGTNFESSDIPTCVSMCGSFDIAELNLERRSAAVYGNGKRNLEHLLVLPPIDPSIETNPRRRAKADPLL